MTKERFLIFIDILGFEILPRELLKNSILDENWVRDSAILQPFNKTIHELKNIFNSEDLSVEKGTDDCIIFVSDLNQVFQVVNIFLEIPLPTKGESLKTIPFEIAIDFVKINDNISNQIASTEIIESLKKNLLKKYRDNYKEEHKESIKESFIVITNSAFDKLEIYQKKECSKFELDREVIYSLPLPLITREFEITDFLSKIGKSRNDASGALIDMVFVPPREYDEILNSFENERIVFLTGPPGYGKTYLTIQLLWLWYKQGYNPIWIKGGESTERSEGRKFLEAIDANKDQKQIIYVEDPFGNVVYEKREKLSQGIDEIIDYIKNNRDTYLILTSRKDIFREFKKDALADKEIEQYEKELNIVMPSYDNEQRKSILDKWANIKNCEWYKDPELKLYARSLIEKKENLPTPLSIHNFIKNSFNIQNKEDIDNEIKKNSESSERIFAKEIIGLYKTGRKDRILLLSLILISENSGYNFLKNQYNSLKKKDMKNFQN